MNGKHVLLTLIVWLFVATTLHSQVAAPAVPKKTAMTVPSSVNGAPPPASAMALSVPQARDAMRQAIKKNFVGAMKVCFLGCTTYEFSAATDFRLSAGGFNFVAHVGPGPAKVSVHFKGENIGYVKPIKTALESCSGGRCYSVGFLPKGRGELISDTLLLWSEEVTAQSFADAFNRLVYAAYHSEDEEEFAIFSAAAKAWRENPAKPPLCAEADRHWILAENAIQEKSLDSAIEHYESAIEAQPMWPEGWFNLGMLYAEQSDFASAADRMKHYLELAPDAPDAKNARTQMIIWEDKVAKGQ